MPSSAGQLVPLVNLTYKKRNLDAIVVTEELTLLFYGFPFHLRFYRRFLLSSFSFFLLAYTNLTISSKLSSDM